MGGIFLSSYQPSLSRHLKGIHDKFLQNMIGNLGLADAILLQGE